MKILLIAFSAFIVLLIFSYLLLSVKVYLFLGSINQIKIGGYIIPLIKFKAFFKKIARRKRNKKKSGLSFPSPSPNAVWKMFEESYRGGDVNISFSTGDPHWDGIILGMSYAMGQKRVRAEFLSEPFFVFSWVTKLLLFVRIGLIWIIDIVRKEVKNVLH